MSNVEETQFIEKLLFGVIWNVQVVMIVNGDLFVPASDSVTLEPTVERRYEKCPCLRTYPIERFSGFHYEDAEQIL